MNARKLRALMVLHGDNIATLAKKIGRSPRTLSRTLNGHRDILVGEVLKIVELYNMPAWQVDEVFLDKSPDGKKATA